jgi:hypothetical protein
MPVAFSNPTTGKPVPVKIRPQGIANVPDNCGPIDAGVSFMRGAQARKLQQFYKFQAINQPPSDYDDCRGNSKL